jgi:2-methylcitrate dehydratase PrpD
MPNDLSAKSRPKAHGAAPNPHLGATRHLAGRALSIDYAKLDQKTITQAKHLLLDHLGCLLLGSTMPWTLVVYRYMTSFGGKPEARVVNHGNRLAAHDAALINAVFSQGFEWDDFATRGMGAGHPGAGTWPAALALGEKRHISGKELIASSVAGYEVMSRIGKAIGGSSDKRGHHRQGIISPLGAAAVSGHILGLSESEMVMALSIAASHAAGINEFGRTGGEVKRLHAGNGVRSGIQSACLAQQGFTGPPTALEGETGFCRVYSAEPLLDELTKDREHLEIMESGIKSYPAVATALTSIEAMGQLKTKHGFGYQDIGSINITVSPRAIEHGGSMEELKDAASSQFSVPFSIALQAVIGNNDVNHYMNPEMWKDARLTDIAKRVTFTPDATAVDDFRHSCRMKITLKNGAVRETYIPYPRGSFLNPLSDDETKEKFALMATRVVGEARVRELIQAVDNIDKMEDVTTLVDLLCSEKQRN